MISGSILPVVDGSGFKTGDNVAIYNPGDNTTWDEALSTVTSASAGSLTLQTALNHSYPSDPASRVIQVAKFNTVEIGIDNQGHITKAVDGVPTILIDGAVLGPDLGLEFDFHGAASALLVELVGIHLSVADPDNPGASIDIKTDVRLRNASS
jgi:hypothetical protein